MIKFRVVYPLLALVFSASLSLNAVADTKLDQSVTQAFNTIAH